MLEGFLKGLRDSKYAVNDVSVSDMNSVNFDLVSSANIQNTLFFKHMLTFF